MAQEPDIGVELEEENTASPDRTKGAFKKFFDDPKNIATALIFGASLAMPREQGQDGLQTMVQRAAGAAAFRGTLQSGVQNAQLKREQTAFERTQAERENQQRERQIGVAEEGVGLQRTQLRTQATNDAMDYNIAERQLMSHDENARLDRDLQSALARLPKVSTDEDYVAIAMQSVPYLLETMEFEEGLTPVQKMEIAQRQALKGVMIFRNSLANAKVVIGSDGQSYVDDGTGPPPPIVPAGAPAPTPPTAPAPQEAPAARAARISQEQRRSSFSPTGSERRELNQAKYAVSQQENMRREQVEFLIPMARRFQRLVEIGGRPQAIDVRRLSELTDQELQQIGLRPQAITGLRSLAQQLPAK